MFLSAGAAGPAASEQLLIQWEVQSDQGTGQVLLLARAAHCMRYIAEARAAGRGASGGAEFEVGRGGRAGCAVARVLSFVWRVGSPLLQRL